MTLIHHRNPVQVVVFPFRILKEEVEYLLLQRTLKRGGGWQGVSGAVEIGEKLDDAAARELMEETGLKAAVQSINFQFEYPITEKFRHIYAPGVESIMEHSFISNITNLGDPTLSEEHDTFKWVKFDEIDVNSLQWEGSRFAIKIANQSIMEQFAI